MARIWVLAADTTRARVFATDKRNGKLVEQFDLVNPEARLQESEFITDQSGRTTNSATGVSHTYGSGEKHKPRAMEAFARDVARRLEEARANGKFAKLYVVAEPSFLGMLRNAMGVPTAKLVAGEVDKNLTRGSVEQLRGVLPDFL